MTARQTAVRKIELKKQALELFLVEYHARLTRKIIELYELEKTLDVLKDF